ncbi:MAG: hypothetical protein NTU54_05470 [Candidatus Omnitrophica bacterium]|nr:hypothetical protein [Candidatus Omnitrophota bacterium]
MKINGSDLILLSLCFGIAGTLILGKGYIFSGVKDIKNESQAYFGSNPFAIKNKIIQKNEGVGGLLLLVISILLQLLSSFLNNTQPKSESIFLSPPYNFFFLVLFTICLTWGCNIIFDSVAKQDYMKVLREMLQEVFTQTEYTLKNDGLYNEDDKQFAQNIPRETRNQRLKQMNERLGHWEDLFSFKRKSNESDLLYFLRLKNM